jgi:hypothetical protein
MTLHHWKSRYETSAIVYPTTQIHIPEEQNLHPHLSGKLQIHIALRLFLLPAGGGFFKVLISNILLNFSSIMQSVLQQVHSLFQSESEFSIQRDLVLPVSSSAISLFP